MQVLIVGAGFAGSIIARELADTRGCKITLIDKRDHIAGNAYDPVHPATGARYHKYGPHIFHTNSGDIVDHLSRFTEWLPYEHKVQVILPGGSAAPMPINRVTLNTFYGVDLADEHAMRAFLDKVRVPIGKPANALEHLHSIYGVELAELFFGRYSRKMWGLDMADMPASVVARLPVRYDNELTYFNDDYQCMPAEGYLPLFERMLDHPDIAVRLNTTFDKRMESQYAHVFNSMPIDEYFENAFGPLPYRSIKFEHRFDESFDYTVPTVNFTDEGKYTRKTAWPLYPACGGVVGSHVTYEIPCSYEENNMERYYPIKTIDGWPQHRYKQYEDLAKNKTNMTFIGRCGQYIYYDMHQVVGNSLSIAKKFIESAGL
jgi:UDP-galactopyranose mutase